MHRKRLGSTIGHMSWLVRLKRRSLILKDVEERYQESQSSNLAKVLGLAELTFLGIGSIVGAGIYVLVGFTAHDIAG